MYSTWSWPLLSPSLPQGFTSNDLPGVQNTPKPNSRVPLAPGLTAPPVFQASYRTRHEPSSSSRLQLTRAKVCLDSFYAWFEFNSQRMRGRKSRKQRALVKVFSKMERQQNTGIKFLGLRSIKPWGQKPTVLINFLFHATHCVWTIAWMPMCILSE